MFLLGCFSFFFFLLFCSFFLCIASDSEESGRFLVTLCSATHVIGVNWHDLVLLGVGRGFISEQRAHSKLPELELAQGPGERGCSRAPMQNDSAAAPLKKHDTHGNGPFRAEERRTTGRGRLPMQFYRVGQKLTEGGDSAVPLLQSA